MSIKNEKGGRIHDCSLLSIALAVILLWPCERVFADNPRVIGGLELSVTTATLSVAQRLAEALQQQVPGFMLELHTQSATATSQWWEKAMPPRAALLARSLNNQERADFHQQWGYAPTGLRIAADAVAVIVHPSNPVAGLRLAELDGIFSAQRRRGHAPIRQWGELGLEAGWRERAVVALAPQQASAVSQHFREQVLEDGDYHRDVVRIQGAARMTDRVSHDADSIGYIARSQWNGMSKVVPVSAGGNGDYVEPTPEEIMAGHYPLGFWLRLYVNHNPREPLDEQLETLLWFCYSRQGQQLLAESGYIGVPEVFVASELEQIGRELR